MLFPFPCRWQTWTLPPSAGIAAFGSRVVDPPPFPFFFIARRLKWHGRRYFPPSCYNCMVDGSPFPKTLSQAGSLLRRASACSSRTGYKPEPLPPSSLLAGVRGAFLFLGHLCKQMPFPLLLHPGDSWDAARVFFELWFSLRPQWFLSPLANNGTFRRALRTTLFGKGFERSQTVLL